MRRKKQEIIEAQALGIGCEGVIPAAQLAAVMLQPLIDDAGLLKRKY